VASSSAGGPLFASTRSRGWEPEAHPGRLEPLAECCGLGRLRGGQVVLLGRIAGEVVEQEIARGGLHQLEAPLPERAEVHASLHLRAVPTAEGRAGVQRLAEDRRLWRRALARREREQRSHLEGRRRLDPQEIEDRGEDAERRDRRLDTPARRHPPGSVHQERDAHHVLVERGPVAEEGVVLAQQLAVIRQHDERCQARSPGRGRRLSKTTGIATRPFMRLEGSRATGPVRRKPGPRARSSSNITRASRRARGAPRQWCRPAVLSAAPSRVASASVASSRCSGRCNPGDVRWRHHGTRRRHPDPACCRMP
jgi:hypothetical protein